MNETEIEKNTENTENFYPADKYEPKKEFHISEDRKFGRGVLEIAEDIPEVSRNARAELARVAINPVASEYQKHFPEELQAIAALSELTPYLKNQGAMETKQLPRQEYIAAIKDMTEYQFLLTDYCEQNTHRPDHMSKFWEAMSKIAGEDGDLLDRLKSGVLSTVATMKCFKAIGGNAVLSHPKEDAFNAIDMWVGNAAVQVKSGRIGDKVLYTTNEVSFPGVRVDDASGVVKHVSSDPRQTEVVKFAQKVHEYSKDIGRPVMGFFICLPRGKDPITGKEFVNSVTGMPSEGLVRRVRTEFLDSLRRAKKPRRG